MLSAGTVIGSVYGGVGYFRGIPYAQPPTGPLRLKPPVRLESFGSAPVDAIGVGPACPQMTAVDITPLLLEVRLLPGAQETLFFGTSTGDETEDCLTMSVMRPQGTPTNAKLPVLFWIYGGGFETGSPQQYDGSVLIPQSVAQGKPMIIVAVNYRLGAFGFLGGKEVLADGAANLGLLDQRMGLQWVADNIEAFGGDPDAVTIWGESAGSIGVFDQLALFDGNHTYKGRLLFRGAIMDSGSITPREPVDGVKAQGIFDTVAEAAGCASVEDSAKLEVAGLVATYPENPDNPAGVGPSNTNYPEFKRLAAILGDWEFTFMSRLLLEAFPATVPAWSYQATYESGTPVLGTYHSTDMPRLWLQADDVSTAIQSLYISFVHPNNYGATNSSGYLTFWPTWQEEKQLLELGAESTRPINDGARAASFEYIRAHLEDSYL